MTNDDTNSQNGTVTLESGARVPSDILAAAHKGSCKDGVDTRFLAAGVENRPFMVETDRVTAYLANAIRDADLVIIGVSHTGIEDFPLLVHVREAF